MLIIECLARALRPSARRVANPTAFASQGMSHQR